MVRDVFFYADKCGARELTKLTDEFNKDLKKLRNKTRVSIWKYIKDTDSGAKKDQEDGALPGPNYDAVPENVISQNPKINYKIAEGFSQQIQNNPLLTHFKLLNYRLS